MFIPFGDFMPDQEALGSPGSPSVLNVAPGERPGTYSSFPSLVQLTSSIGSRPLGGIGALDSADTPYTYIGTASGIFLLQGTSWTDKTKAGGYNLLLDDQWDCAQYRDRVIFTSLSDPIQFDTVNGTGFTDLLTSTRKPKARRIAVVNRDWIVLGDTTDIVDGDTPGRIWWLARGDPTDADPDTVTQCGFEDLDSGDGRIQKIIGAEFGTIYTTRAIWRMTYEGGDTQYRFDKVSINKGAICSGGIVSIGRTSFFIDEDGFWRFDGVTPTPLAEGKWNKMFWSEVDASNLAWISTAVDYRRSLIVWAYPRSGNMPDRLLVYNWKTDRASVVDLSIGRLFNGFTPTLFTDDLSVASVLIDRHPYKNIPVDSPEFIGSLHAFSAFSIGNELWGFTGEAMPATLTTAEYDAEDGNARIAINGVRPRITGGGSPTVAVGIREGLNSSSVSWTPDIAVNLAGEAPVLCQGRYLRVRVKTTGEFSHALGVTVNANPIGYY